MKNCFKKMNQVFVMAVLGLAVTNLSSACMFWVHQPEVPNCLRETD